MTPDTDNAYGIAAMFVAGDGHYAHGMNYVLYTDGTGEMGRNKAGEDWKPWDALPTHDVTTLNEGTGEYETVRTLSVDIGDVVEWSPWTIYMSNGDWWYRSNTNCAWEKFASVQEQSDNPTHAPGKPTEFVTPE